MFRFGVFAPAAEIEGFGHASVAQFVREGAIDQGSGDDHAANAHGSDALRGGAARAAILNQAAFEDADHGLEDGLEGGPGGFPATGDVGRQRDHRAGIFNIFKMLEGEIGADDLGADVA